MSRRSKNGTNGDVGLDTLKNDLSALQRDMRLLLEKVATATAEQAHDVANGAAESVETLASEGTEKVRDLIRSQPLAAIALSMTAGAALSFFLRR